MQSQIENKCDLCGLKVNFDQSALQKNQTVEEFFANLRNLQKNNLVPNGWGRHIKKFIGNSKENDSSEICAINHSSWLDKNKNCKFWQPQIGLTLGEYMASHESKKMEILTKDIHKLTAIATFIPIIYLTIELYKHFK